MTSSVASNTTVIEAGKSRITESEILVARMELSLGWHSFILCRVALVKSVWA
jgi:hypothetical protein